MECFVTIVLPILSFIVSSATLGFLIRYTLLTKSIAQAAQDQAEGMHKPVLILERYERLRSETENLFEQIETERPIGTQVARHTDGYLYLENVGSGTALNIEYSCFPLGSIPTARGDHHYLRSLGFLAVDERIRTPVLVTYADANDLEFIVNYDSLSRHRYRTRIVLKRRVFDSVEFSSTNLK